MFGVDEMFFSRTDARGVILSGNAVFQRISGFGWTELENAPHKIVRHPDMPKAVFWVLWDRLKKGLPVGAYVKNRTKTGGFYWVYAFATPFEDGYLSIRIRPSSELFDTVQGIYGALLEAETTESLSPEQSAARLMGWLADAGFRDYTAFMAYSANAELGARSAQLSRPDQVAFHGNCRNILDTATSTLHEAASVMNFLRNIRSFPINLTVQAMRLNGNDDVYGKIFGVVSSDYARICRKIEAKITGFLEGSIRMADRVCMGGFMLCAAHVQSEMATTFERECKPDDGMDDEIRRLSDQATAYVGQTRQALDEIETEAAEFYSYCTELIGLAGALDAARAIGMIEACRLDRRGVTLRKMMSEATAYQTEIADHLAKLQSLSSAVGDQTRRLSEAA